MGFITCHQEVLEIVTKTKTTASNLTTIDEGLLFASLTLSQIFREQKSSLVRKCESELLGCV